MGSSKRRKRSCRARDDQVRPSVDDASQSCEWWVCAHCTFDNNIQAYPYHCGVCNRARYHAFGHSRANSSAKRRKVENSNSRPDSARSHFTYIGCTSRSRLSTSTDEDAPEILHVAPPKHSRRRKRVANRESEAVMNDLVHRMMNVRDDEDEDDGEDTDTPSAQSVRAWLNKAGSVKQLIDAQEKKILTLTQERDNVKADYDRQLKSVRDERVLTIQRITQERDTARQKIRICAQSSRIANPNCSWRRARRIWWTL